MKSRETKQKDLVALTESLAASKSAMVVSFTKLTVTKDQEFRRSLRDAGASYQVVKNTLARIAVKGTQFADTTEHFKGVTAIAWTENDPVVLTKAISKFMKDNADIYSFKTGVVDGQLIDLNQLTTIANLPSKEELISKLLWVLNSSAERLVTVINAVPRDLAIVIKQIGDAKPAGEAPAAEVKAEAPAPAPAVEESAPEAEVATEAPASEEVPAAEVQAETEPATVEAAPADEAPVAEAAPEETPVEAAPAAEAETVEAAADEAPAAVAEPAEEAPAAEAEATNEAPVAEPAEEAPAAETEASAEHAASPADDNLDDILEMPSEAEAKDKA